MNAIISNARLAISAALSDRRGVSTVEYGVLAAGIIGVVVAGMAVLGTGLNAAFKALGDAIALAF